VRRRLALAALVALALGCFAPAARGGVGLPSHQGRALHALALELATKTQPTSQRRPVGLESKLELEADGYQVAVEGFGEDVAVLVTEQGRRGEAVSAYLVRGTVTRGALRAKIGDLGTISMRFRLGGGRSISHPRECHGRHRFLVRRGVFVGSFRFRGEGGYLTSAAHRAKGRVREIAPRCQPHRRPARLALAAAPHTTKLTQKPERPYLYAARQHGVSSSSVLALKTKRGRTELLANQETIRGTMAIIRVASVEAGPMALQADDALTRARLTAPAPFGGDGSFSAAADGARAWNGDFSVAFPGRADFPLTGPEYDAEVGRTADPLFFLFSALSRRPAASAPVARRARPGPRHPAVEDPLPKRADDRT
jgi:hypothetical protein